MKNWERHQSASEFFVDYGYDFISVVSSFVAISEWVERTISRVSLSRLEFYLSILIIANAVVWLFSRGNKMFPAFKTKYVYKSKSVKYRVDENKSLSVSMKIDVKSASDELNQITENCLWTGNTMLKCPNAGSNVKGIHETTHIGISKWFNVELKEPMMNGEERTISYKWSKIRDCRDLSPFVSIDTEYPTKLIRFEIDLGKAYANCPVMLGEYRSVESDFPIRIRKAHFDDDGCIVWEVTKPRRFMNYRIKWTWNENETPEVDNVNDE